MLGTYLVAAANGLFLLAEPVLHASLEAHEVEEAHLFAAPSKSASLSLPSRVVGVGTGTGNGGHIISFSAPGGTLPCSPQRRSHRRRGLGRWMATLHRDRWAVGHCGSLAAPQPGCLNGRTWKKKREIKQKRRTEENSICKQKKAQEVKKNKKKKRGDQPSRTVSE